MTGTDFFVISCFALIVFASLFVLYLAMQSRWRLREMQHRERLAMIERGIVPRPEVDPGRFEAAFANRGADSSSSVRMRSAGVMMIGMGGALMFLIAFPGEAPAAGVGVGGAFAVIGATFLVNSMLMRKFASGQPQPADRRADTRDVPPTPPPAPPEH